jgi:redox-sensitive bicupin YhaK (pirin superfamily)
MEKNNRRNFLTKLSAGAIALLAMPVKSFSKSFQNQYQSTLELMETPTAPNPIIRVKPMGFQWETLDPFLFCVHHEDKFPKGNDEMGPDASLLAGRHMGDDFIIKDGWRMYHGKKVPGFPAHPHRGFETITIVREGLVDHSDSLGAAGRYGEGDVQWMTAGKGVQHAEMFPLINKDKENHMELFQIWLNLPKKNKMVEPHFKMLWGSTIPKYKHQDTKGLTTEIEIIAGSLKNHKAPTPPPNSWAADPNNEVAIYNIKMQPDATFILPKVSAGINRCVYFYAGSDISVGEQSVHKYNAIEVKSDVDLHITNSSEEARILILQGRPIKEHVIQYGPFVMNTKEEINQAFEDYHRTGFGGWPWKRADQVHEREKVRFALHADGTLEKGV